MGTWTEDGVGRKGVVGSAVTVVVVVVDVEVEGWVELERAFEVVLLDVEG